MNQHGLHTTQIFNLSIVSESFAKVADFLTNYKGKTLIVCTPNPEQLVLASRDSQFHEDLAAADLLLPDGAGLVKASHWLATRGKVAPIKERITGIDMVERLLADARRDNRQVVVIGGRGYERLFTETKEREKCWHWTEGYHTIDNPTPEEEAAVVQLLTTVQPEHVFVALGAPAQERWLITHREVLEKSNVAVAMAVGGSFDIISGQLQRAPHWVRQLHSEWLYRLVQEPWRLKRQFKLLEFIKLVLFY